MRFLLRDHHFSLGASLWKVSVPHAARLCRVKPTSVPQEAGEHAGRRRRGRACARFSCRQVVSLGFQVLLSIKQTRGIVG